jgi:hypothetical protein
MPGAFSKIAQSAVEEFINFDVDEFINFAASRYRLATMAPQSFGFHVVVSDGG